MRAIALALRHRELRLLLTAGLVSLTGDWVLRVGLAYYVYALTGSTLASALMLLASFVPQILLGSLAGVFVDRWDLRRTMVVGEPAARRSACCRCWRCTGPSQIWIVYAVTAWEGCVAAVLRPGRAEPAAAHGRRRAPGHRERAEQPERRPVPADRLRPRRRGGGGRRDHPARPRRRRKLPRSPPR